MIFELTSNNNAITTRVLISVRPLGQSSGSKPFMVSHWLVSPVGLVIVESIMELRPAAL